MTLIAIALAFLVGLALGMLGGGGSILTLPILRYVMGLEGRQAIAMSLLVVAATAAVAMIAHARAGRVRWATGAIFGVASMLGAFAAGRWLAPLLPAAALLVLFAGLMAATALAMLRNGRRPTAPEAIAPAASSAPAARRGAGALAAIFGEGLVVGGVTGLVGAGGGFLVVPALVLLGGLSMELAVGTSLMVIAMKSLAGFAGYASHVSIDWVLTGKLTAMAIAGTLLGARLASKVSPAALREGFAWFVVLMAWFVSLQEAPPLFGYRLPMGVVLVTALGATGAIFGLTRLLRSRPAITQAKA